MKGNFQVRFGERSGETRRLQGRKVRPAPTLRDGINWYVTRNNAELAAGGFENSGAQDFQNGLGGDSLSAISVNEGDYIYLAFDPKGGDNCDSTLVYVTTISMH
jgi:hypothetical protein